MFEPRFFVREKFGALLGRVGRALRKAEDETERETGGKVQEPQSEEEDALHQAMGWSEAEGEDAADVALEKISEEIEKI